MNKKLETKRILLYLAITFFITCAYCFGVVYPLNNNANLRESASVITQLAVAVVMFVPAIGVLLTRLITKEGFQNAWIKPHFKGNIGIYLLAYFGPGILTFLGVAIYFLIFPNQFDSECSYLIKVLESSGASVSELPISLPVLMFAQAVQALFLGPILNFFTCFGEEWGWRGYLLPKMKEKLPPIPMLLVNGLIWGLWHAPLTAIGHNYGMGYSGFPVKGILAMCLFCTVVGVFLSYISLKTESCIPAVLSHGAINSISGIGIYLTKDGGNPFIGPAPSGIVGMIPFMIAAVLICVFYFGRKKQ